MSSEDEYHSQKYRQSLTACYFVPPSGDMENHYAESYIAVPSERSQVLIRHEAFVPLEWNSFLPDKCTCTAFFMHLKKVYLFDLENYYFTKMPLFSSERFIYNTLHTSPWRPSKLPHFPWEFPDKVRRSS